MKTMNKEGIREWGEEEMVDFMRMLKGGQTIMEISKKLKRSVDEIFDEMKRVLIIKVPETEEPQEGLITGHDKCRAMASAARQVARANGKRITMSIFYVKDL